MKYLVKLNIKKEIEGVDADDAVNSFFEDIENETSNETLVSKLVDLVEVTPINSGPEQKETVTGWNDRDAFLCATELKGCIGEKMLDSLLAIAVQKGKESVISGPKQKEETNAAKFECPDCNNVEFRTAEELAESGNPVCPGDDSDMILSKEKDTRCWAQVDNYYCKNKISKGLYCKKHQYLAE